MKNPKLVLLKAELLASTPAEVKSWLETRAQRSSFYQPEEEADIEEALLGCKSDFIDLALARFGVFPQTLVELFARNATEHDKALRLAVLLNETAGRGDFNGFPGVLYTRAKSMGKDQLEWFLSGLEAEEISALFGNPALGNSFLVAFLEQKKPWQMLDETGRMLALSALADNPRMVAGYEGPMDGWAEHMHDSAFTAAFNLAETVPVSMAWAVVLGSLYYKTKPTAYSIEDPIALAARWTPEPGDAEMVEAEAKAFKDGYVTGYAQVRQGISRLAVAGYRKKLSEVLTHPDPAVRSAAYREADLTLDQMREANTLDPQLGFNTMLYNKAIWRKPETRELLKEMAWEPARDPSNDLIPQNQYKSFLREMRKDHHDWFVGEDAEPAETDSAPVTRGEFTEAIATLTRSVETSVAQVSNMEGAMKTVLGRTGWIWWGVAVAIAILIFRR